MKQMSSNKPQADARRDSTRSRLRNSMLHWLEAAARIAPFFADEPPQATLNEYYAQLAAHRRRVALAVGRLKQGHHDDVPG
ncbi:MAG: hypothetical protein ISP90_00400 [Nevskia sp.]|nr:hypothetical protein [Nevskia sp.]